MNDQTPPVQSGHLPVEIDALREENSVLRAERQEYRSALYAVLWQSVSPPTAEELASAEPIGPWFDELIRQLQQSNQD